MTLHVTTCFPCHCHQAKERYLGDYIVCDCLSACVDAASGMALSPVPGCVLMSRSFLLSRCAYKAAPDATALVIKA